ncbi:MAG: hypothetical protein PWQ77_621 [Kosmotogales bacterium]|nr:hypothetical protein [Kosmotogales bacterium]
MNAVFTYILYGVTFVLLIVSFLKDKSKTLLSLKKAWKMFINILPQFIAILMLVGLLLEVINSETIQHVIGSKSGIAGILISSLLGVFTLVPVLIAFPIAAELLNNGAGIAQTAVFISTLTMVGFITLPMETKYLGKKIALLRNGFAFLFALISACIIGVILV